jgi:hypothetical protein
MMSVYNSISEIKLRILLLLEVSTQEYLSSDMIAALDFITVYGKEFGVSDKNLHGDNRYKFSELPSRREIVSKAIKSLVVDGMLDISLKNGFEYQINNKGFKFIDSFETEYSDEYSKNASLACEKYGDMEESELFKMIQSKSVVPIIREEE